MKNLYNFSLIFLFMVVVSCKTQTDKNKHVQFQWKIAGCLPDHPDGTQSIGLAGPVAGILHNRLIIGGGSNFPDGAPWDGGKKIYYDKIYVFKKEDDSLIPVKQDFHLPYPVAYSANCTTDKGIVVAGGENKTGALNKVMLISWNTDEQNITLRYLPDLPRSLSSGAIAAINSHIYFAGGQNADMVSDQLYHLDLNYPEKGWNTLPNLPLPVTHTVLYAQSNRNDSCLYLVGGRKRNIDSTSTLYSEVYQFSLKTGKWSQKSSLPYALSAHTGLVWNDSTLLVFSGDRGKSFHATEVLIQEITHEKNNSQRERLIQEKDELQKSHPGFGGNVLLYNTRTDKWEKTDTIPFPGQVTTTALKWNNEIVIPCGEIRAGVRTPDIVIGQ